MGQNPTQQTIRENGKSKKRIISHLGKLTLEKAQQIRNVLKISQSTDTIVTTFDDLLFEDHWHYLDVAFLNQISRVEGIKSERFRNFTEKTLENEIISIGLTKYDNDCKFPSKTEI